MWLLFVFVNAVYTGALTMHFATPPDFPFENLREVLRELASFFFLVLTSIPFLIVIFLLGSKEVPGVEDGVGEGRGAAGGAKGHGGGRGL